MDITYLPVSGRFHYRKVFQFVGHFTVDKPLKGKYPGVTAHIVNAESGD